MCLASAFKPEAAWVKMKAGLVRAHRPEIDRAHIRTPCATLTWTAQQENERGLTKPICSSTANIRRLEPGTINFDSTRFSTANTTPSLTLRPIAVLKPQFEGY